ncbi:MAG TPA: CGNR zinc finger domain-containing protein [Alphaproteobacteria bacterium]|nr:CGNR zinc finger domain-containing protein [Alphaproteobacteria bacterium]
MAEPRPAPSFVGGDLALDFLNTVASPWGREIEWLANGRDLVVWLAQVNAVPVNALARIGAVETPHALNKVAADVRHFREWFRTFVHKNAGKRLARLSAEELAALNKILASDKAYRQIEGTLPGDVSVRGDSMPCAFHWRSKRRWEDATSLIYPIFDAIGDFIVRKDFTYVRKCERADCTLWFLDVSKSHARRWCSMAVCGNRAKAAAYRARGRQHS